MAGAPERGQDDGGAVGEQEQLWWPGFGVRRSRYEEREAGSLCISGAKTSWREKGAHLAVPGTWRGPCPAEGKDEAGR